jgi:sec-independent protein translocase protein TatA
MFKSFGIWEIVLILVIIVIIFGVGKLPQIGGAIGKGIRSFKKAQSGEDEAEDKKAATTSSMKKTDDKTEKS